MFPAASSTLKSSGSPTGVEAEFPIIVAAILKVVLSVFDTNRPRHFCERG